MRLNANDKLYIYSSEYVRCVIYGTVGAQITSKELYDYHILAGTTRLVYEAIGSTSISDISIFDGTGSETIKIFINGTDVASQTYEGIPLLDSGSIVIGGRLINNTFVAPDSGASITSLPDEGQQTMANSISVAIASDQSPVPVSGSFSITPSGTQDVVVVKKSQLLDYSVDGDLVYLGKAAPGNLSSDSIWAISKYSYDVDGNLISITWADGNTDEDNIYDNRASLSYS